MLEPIFFGCRYGTVRSSFGGADDTRRYARLIVTRRRRPSQPRGRGGNRGSRGNPTYALLARPTNYPARGAARAPRMSSAARGRLRNRGRQCEQGDGEDRQTSTHGAFLSSKE